MNSIFGNMQAWKILEFEASQESRPRPDLRTNVCTYQAYWIRFDSADKRKHASFKLWVT